MQILRGFVLMVCTTMPLLSIHQLSQSTHQELQDVPLGMVLTEKNNMTIVDRVSIPPMVYPVIWAWLKGYGLTGTFNTHNVALSHKKEFFMRVSMAQWNILSKQLARENLKRYVCASALGSLIFVGIGGIPMAVVSSLSQGLSIKTCVEAVVVGISLGAPIGVFTGLCTTSKIKPSIEAVLPLSQHSVLMRLHGLDEVITQLQNKIHISFSSSKDGFPVLQGKTTEGDPGHS